MHQRVSASLYKVIHTDEISPLTNFIAIVAHFPNRQGNQEQLYLFDVRKVMLHLCIISYLQTSCFE